jgi:oligopeptide/dipeptide ABC transporter ATP-binding protein
VRRNWREWGFLRLSAVADDLCRIRGLTISYVLGGSRRVRAVNDLNLTIGRGEIVGILGESGSGKSTLASAILNLLPANAEREGSILLRDRDLLEMSDSELREIRGREVSLVPQDPALALNPVMNAGTQIGEVLRAHLSLRGKPRRERALELLAEVGFDHPQQIYGAYPYQLSGGQRQRVAIAQAIACHPVLVIADEPTSKLDAPAQAGIAELLAQIRGRGCATVVLITHDPAILAGLADRVAVIYAGRVIEVGTTAQIFQHPLHPYTQALLQIAKSAVTSSTGSTSRRLAAIEGDSPDPTSLPSGCCFYPRCPERMEQCRQRYPEAFFPEPSRPVNCFKYGE